MDTLQKLPRQLTLACTPTSLCLKATASSASKVIPCATPHLHPAMPAILLMALLPPQVAPGDPQEAWAGLNDSRMHRTLCPQTASLSIADVITATPGPRHTKLMCLLDPSAFTMGAGGRHKAKRPEGLLARLSMGGGGASSPSKSGSPIKSSQIKVWSNSPKL